ncbi:MAG: hypothetical protein ABIR28_07165, partial [Vicinamibacteria bacterium]
MFLAPQNESNSYFNPQTSPPARAMTKYRSIFACQACGFQSSKWLGRCPECGDWNTFTEEREEIQSSKASKQQRALSETMAKPKPYDMVDA